MQWNYFMLIREILLHRMHLADNCMAASEAAAPANVKLSIFERKFNFTLRCIYS